MLHVKQESMKLKCDVVFYASCNAFKFHLNNNQSGNNFPYLQSCDKFPFHVYDINKTQMQENLEV